MKPAPVLRGGLQDRVELALADDDVHLRPMPESLSSSWTSSSRRVPLIAYSEPPCGTSCGRS
jgi:hypothetical protein